MIPYFPFTSQPFKREMGLKVLELKDWIEPDGDWEAQTRLKRELLRDHRDTVLAFSDEQAAREPAAELLELLRAHLKEYHPAIYARTSAYDAAIASHLAKVFAVAMMLGRDRRFTDSTSEVAW